MIIIYISIAVFIIMLLFPVTFSLLHFRKNSGEVMKIEQTRVKDPRYFVKSFTAKFDKNWANYDGSGKVFLSREEKILEADKYTEYSDVCTRIVYAENQDFRPNPGVRFEKEIYARQNAYLNGIVSVRAICSKKDLVLGIGTQILRWADAEGTLVAFDGCDLGISTSSNTKIILGNNCCFRRLYAPVIFFGQAPEEESPLNETIKDVDSRLDTPVRFMNIKYVSDDLADKDGVFKGSIITTHMISVLENISVTGHIRSHKSIRLCDNSIVFGNLFAEGDIYLGQNARVYGSIFTQGGLYAESGVVIGQPGKIKSVVVRGKAVFNKGCSVFGYVSSETIGECCPEIKISRTYRFFMRFLSHLRIQDGYIRRRIWPAVTSIIVAFAVIAVGIYGTAALKILSDNEKALEERKTAVNGLIYGVDGKPGGGQLETEPTLVTEDYVFFKDRVLERFHYDANNISEYCSILGGLMASQPEGIKKYLMLVPTRISLEDDKYKQYSDDVNSAIAEIYARMPSDVTTLDAAGALIKNKGNYMFFRTDSSWTALGAYYGAGEFCKSAGIEMKDIAEYRGYRLEGYLGPMRKLPNTESLKDYPDYVNYYILEGAANEQTITARITNDEYLTYKSPTVALSRRGNDICIGSYYSHSILQGDEKNGKTLMIFGDEYCKAFAPWLTPYYENVILVDLEFYNGSPEQFLKLFSEYKITDFLFIESAQNLVDSEVNSDIKEIFSK